MVDFGLCTKLKVQEKNFSPRKCFGDFYLKIILRTNSIMEIPKVIEELIFSYANREHPICKLLRDERKRLRYLHEYCMPYPEVFAHPRSFHDDSFFPYDTFVEQGRVSRHFFNINTSESFYCHRCGESYTELPTTNIDRCECWVYDYATVPNAANNP